MSPHTSQVGGGFDYMPSGIYKHKKGYKRPPFSEKTKKKMSEAKMGDKNPAKRPEVIEKIRKTLLGRKKKLGYFFSPETIRNFSITRKGKKRLPFSKEWRKRISEGHKGSKHYNWQGGKSYEQYTIDWTKDLKESIRKRDSYVCQLCGIDQKEFNGFYKKLDVHHIDYDKKNLNPINLISLCRKCHIKTNGNRDYWKSYL